MIYVKSGSHWIQLDYEEVKKVSQKTVVEAWGNSGGDREQPLATRDVKVFRKTIVLLWKRQQKIENETIVFENDRFFKFVF